MGVDVLTILLIGGLLAWLTYVVLAVRFAIREPERPPSNPSGGLSDRLVSRHHVGDQAAAESLVLHATQGRPEAGATSGDEPSAPEPVKENEDGEA
jgi:hypothetical protein